MLLSDAESMASASSLASTSTQSLEQSTASSASKYSRHRLQFTTPAAGINIRSILDDQFDVITNKYLGSFEYGSVPSLMITRGVELLKQAHSDPGSLQVPIIYDLSKVELTEADRALRPPSTEDDDNNKDDQLDQTLEVADEFKRYYGTSITASVPESAKPYLDFSKPTSEVQDKLSKLLATHASSSLKSKTTLTEDIEQQFAIRPFRVSTRARKKANAEAKKATLPNYFDMPRVAEITKEQEKDLVALKMRHVWNSKSFYKKSALGDIGSGTSGAPDTTKYFQLGTVVEDKADFYADRVPKKQRKATIIDELMNDQEARANQKRKVAAAMATGRVRKAMMKAKMRRQKSRAKERKDMKTEKAFGDVGMRKKVNTFRTYEI